MNSVSRGSVLAKSAVTKPASMLLTLLLASTLAMPSMAADKKDKNARRFQQMAQQAEQEKAVLQTQVEQEKQAKSALEDQVKKTAREADTLKGNLSAASRKAGSLAAELQRSNTEKQALEAKLAQLQTQLESTQKSLSDLTSQYQAAQQDINLNAREKTTLVTTLGQKEKGLEVCEAKNSKLYAYGLELVKMYERPGVYETILRTEPFTQIKRVELENIFQDYNDKLDAQRVGLSRK